MVQFNKRKEVEKMAKEMLLGVADVLIIGSNGLQLASGTLSSHTIEQTVDASDLRGGRQNKIIGRLRTNKGLSVTVEDLQQTKEFQAFMSGSKIVDGAITAYSMPKEVAYVADGITLSPTPAPTITKLPCELPDGSKVEGTVTAGKLTVAGAGAGDKVLIGGYTYQASDAKSFKIQGGKFAENVTVVLEEDVYDGETMQIIGVKQTIIPVAAPDENFSLSGSKEIGESTVSYTFTALSSGACDDLGYVVYLPYDAESC